MTVDQMRNALAQIYSGPMWRLRVGGMSNRQVVAIYKSMEREGRLEKKKPKKQEPELKHCEQMTIWDIMEDKK